MIQRNITSRNNPNKIVLQNLRVQIQGLEISNPEKSKLESVVGKFEGLGNVMCNALWSQGVLMLKELINLVKK